VKKHGFDYQLKRGIKKTGMCFVYSWGAHFSAVDILITNDLLVGSVFICIYSSSELDGIGILHFCQGLYGFFIGRLADL
jgi:hypothetical protein